MDRDSAIDEIVDVSLAAASLGAVTDKYFSHTRRVVEADGDCEVTYAVFLRRRVIAALEPAIRLIKRLVPEAEITRFFDEGEIVPSETRMLSIKGPFSKLSEVETLMQSLQHT